MEKIFIHLELYSDTIFNYEWVKNKIVTFSNNTYTRIYLCILIIFSTFLNYQNTIQRHSDEKIFLNIKYHHLYLLVYSIIIAINILFLFYILEKTSILPYNQPILIGCIVLSLFYLYYIYSNTSHITNQNTFSPPPKLLSYISRIILNLFIILLTLYQFTTEYNLNVKESAGENTLQKYYLNRFGGFVREDSKKNKILFLSGWSKILEIIIQILLLFITILYKPCKYNLPSSWDF